jgi:hypothetical protein
MGEILSSVVVFRILYSILKHDTLFAILAKVGLFFSFIFSFLVYKS